MIKDVTEKYKRKYCDSIAEWMIIAWLILPLFMGIINYIMLTQFDYDAYVYYDCYKIVVATILSIMLISSILFVLVSVGLRKWDIAYFNNKIFSNEKWLIFWILLPIWSLVCVYFSVSKSDAFWGCSYMAEGYMAHLFGLSMMLCASFIRTKIEREKVLTLFCIVTDILTIVMLSFEYSVPFIKNFSAATGVSTYANSNHFGYILCMAILCMAGMYFMCNQEDMNLENNKKPKMTIFFLFSYFINVFALMINNTLGAYLAVLFGLIILMVFWKIRVGRLSIYHFWPFIILTILTVISFAGFLDNQLGGSIGKSFVVFVLDLLKIKHKTSGYRDAGSLRLGLWLDSLEAIGKRPIWGYGPGVRYDLEGNEIINTLPHNEYIECALFLGIPGLILYLGGLITLCVDRCKKLKSLDYTDIIVAGALVGYLISAFVGARRFYTSPYMFVFIGMLINWNYSSGLNKSDISEKSNSESSKGGTSENCKIDSKGDKKITSSIRMRAEELIKMMNRKAIGAYFKDEKYGIERACMAVLLAWTVMPALAALGFIPIGIVHGGDFLILTYYQIMYNFSIVCLLGVIGFIIFMVILSKKRDRIQMSSGALFKSIAKKEVWIVLLLALLGWTFISTILSDNVVTSIIGTASKRDGFLAYCMYASVFGLAYFIDNQNMVKKFMIWYATVANIMGLIMMFYEWQIPVLSYMSHSFSSASFMNPNHFGYYLCMSIMCLVGLFYTDLYRDKGDGEKALSKAGVFYVLSLVWQMYILMINNTLGAYVAIVITMFVILIFMKIRYGKLGYLAFVPIIITILVTMMSYFGLITNIWGETVGECIEQLILDIFTVAKHAEGFEHAGTNRMGLWIEALKLIPQRPIFGFGPESLTGLYKEANTYDRPHNEYIQMAVFCGIPALIMYLSALITLCVNRCKQLKTISPITIAVAGVVIGYLISAFFGFTIYYTTPYFFIFLGFIAGSAKEKTE